MILRRRGLLAPGKSRIGLGWGLVDQGLSSATNFGLSILAGRLLGPGGLGTVFVGFATYLLLLEFQQSLLQEPLVITSASSKDASATRSALAIGLVYQIGAALCMLMVGSMLPDRFGRGLVLLAPWMVPLLFQDLCRTILFRDQRGGLAAACDGIWAAAMLLSFPLVLTHRSDVAVVACWGVGALAGALLGLAAIALRPSGLRSAWAWWRSEALPLARWLGLESAGLVLGTQGAVFLIAALVGARNLGGLRAVQAAFAPMTLIGPALRMPGLSAIARALKEETLEQGAKKAKAIAVRLSLIATSLVVVYFLLLIFFGGQLLTLMFGPSFLPFRSLILPVGLGQLAGASALGFYVLLKGSRRGRAILWTRTLTASATLTFIMILAWHGNVWRAAWGNSLGSVAGWIAVGFISLRRPRAARGRSEAHEDAVPASSVEPEAMHQPGDSPDVLRSAEAETSGRTT